jgi:hypothetical protein
MNFLSAHTRAQTHRTTHMATCMHTHGHTHNILYTAVHIPVAARIQLYLYMYTTGFLKRYILSRIALRLLEIIGPYLVEQNRMANAQFLWYGLKHLGQNFFFLIE